MEFIFEILVQFLGEIVLQAVFEILAEVGMHSLADTVKQPRHVVWSTIGFVLWGAIAGGLSLLLLPHSFVTDPALRVVNVVVTPLLAGTIMMLIGRRRSRRGTDLVQLDRFGYAFAFALTMAIVRYAWAK